MLIFFSAIVYQTPFRSGNKKKTLDAILKKKLQIPYYVSADAKDLLIRVSIERLYILSVEYIF